MNKRILLIFISLQLSLLAIAQNTRLQNNSFADTGLQAYPDTSSLLNAFKKGRFNLRFRYFFMNTLNEQNLADYYANAIGGALRYETAKFHNFQLAIGGSTAFNIGSSDLAKADAVTGLFSRYEVGLFNIQHPASKKDISRLDELYLKYSFKNSYIKAGRQFIKSTFINLQDGRMNATAVEAVWAEINQVKKINFQLGWIWKISPRGTANWYSPGASMGIYSTGVNADGTKSGYANNIKSSGVAVFQLQAALTKNIKLSVADMYLLNVSNSSLTQVDYSYTLKNSAAIFAGVQAITQFAVKDGGNKNQPQTYMLKGSRSFTFGGKIGWKNTHWETSFNYNRITKTGRYLSPREWGLEPFFTFLARERNEGFADVQAVMGKVIYLIPKARFKALLAAGYFHLPDVKNYEFNKYGLPSYTQINVDVNYGFSNALKGLAIQLLIIKKLNQGETYGIKNYVINKVNMVQYNIILNYNL
ncbi:hypothetical protein BH11BAC3_BH11BAC3_11270 [soil metagenome]